MAMQDRDEATRRVIDELKRIYGSKVAPIEETFSYSYFFSPPLTGAELDSKPQVLMVGQYSVGKTSFIRYLIGRDFPGQRIGPEPTTDRFVAVMDGPDERVIPGNALAVSADLPYRGLERYGVSFLNKFQGSQLPSPVLRNITLVDSPGVLSGEKQRVARGYDFANVCGWFADRADLILLLFDAHKLDISDEFKGIIEQLRGNEDKIRCVLNKADQVDRQKLMRVYGALLWSLGKVLRTPEVLRVYVGSFWDQPLMYEDNAALFELEEADLMRDLRDLPRNSAVRKINELVKRVRILRVHCFILSYLKEEMPMLMGREKKQEELLADLPTVFRTVMKRHNLAPGDFPDLEEFRDKLAESQFHTFPKVNQRILADIESTLTQDIPRLMEALPRAHEGIDQEIAIGGGTYADDASKMPALDAHAMPDVPLPERHRDNPFGDQEANPFDGPEPWELDSRREEFSQTFYDANPENGKLSGGAARPLLLAYGLDTPTLRKIWDLSDLDKDGAIDIEEFTIAMVLCQVAQNGEEIPDALPVNWVPPSRR